MKLCVLVSDYRNMDDTVSRLEADKLGLVFVSNGVYHAAVKEAGKASPLLEKSPNLYALAEDLQVKGLDAALDPRVRTVTYGDLVKLIFDEYEKVIWV